MASTFHTNLDRIINFAFVSLFWGVKLWQICVILLAYIVYIRILSGTIIPKTFASTSKTSFENLINKYSSVFSPIKKQRDGKNEPRTECSLRCWPYSPIWRRDRLGTRLGVGMYGVDGASGYLQSRDARFNPLLSRGRLRSGRI